MNCDIRPTSLVSKFAFSCSPTTFVPYDRIVRGQLNKRIVHRQLKIREHDYLAYTRAFAEQRADVDQQLRTFTRRDGQIGLSAKNLPLYRNVMNQQLFEARTTDWYLLLEGGYDPITARNPIHHYPMV